MHLKMSSAFSRQIVGVEGWGGVVGWGVRWDVGVWGCGDVGVGG